MAGAGDDGDELSWDLGAGTPYISRAEEETVVGAGQEEEEGQEASLGSSLGLRGTAGLTWV
jgi:hypothetical protein